MPRRARAAARRWLERAAPRAPCDHRRGPARGGIPTGPEIGRACERRSRAARRRARGRAARPSCRRRWRASGERTGIQLAEAIERDGCPAAGACCSPTRAQGNLSTRRGRWPRAGRCERREQLAPRIWACAGCAPSRQVHGTHVHTAPLPTAQGSGRHSTRRRRPGDRARGVGRGRARRRLPAGGARLRGRRGDGPRRLAGPGRRGARGGRAAVRELGRATGRCGAVIGPCAGPCCYEVGPEVHDGARRAATARAPRSTCARSRARRLLGRGRGGRPGRRRRARSATSASSPTAAKAAAGRAAGGDRMVELISGLDAGRVRANLAAHRGGDRAAAARCAARRTPAASAGRGPRGDEVRRPRRTCRCSPRPACGWSARTAPRTCRRRSTAHGELFEWDFIGQLQSRRVRTDRPARAPDPLGRLGVGAARARAPPRAGPAGAEDPDRGQPRRRARARRGSPPSELDAFIAALPVPRRGPDDDAAARRRPRGQPPAGSPRCAQLADERGLEHLSMGTSQDYLVAVEEGATIVRIGTQPV